MHQTLVARASACSAGFSRRPAVMNLVGSSGTDDRHGAGRNPAESGLGTRIKNSGLEQVEGTLILNDREALPVGSKSTAEVSIIAWLWVVEADATQARAARLRSDDGRTNRAPSEPNQRQRRLMET